MKTGAKGDQEVKQENENDADFDDWQGVSREKESSSSDEEDNVNNNRNDDDDQDGGVMMPVPDASF